MGQKLSKNQRFRKLTVARTDKIVIELQKINKMAGSKNYTYSEDEEKSLLTFLQKRVSETKKAFKDARVNPTPEFKWED